VAITRVNAAVGTVQEGTGTTFTVPYPASTTILANDVIVLVAELNSASAPGVPGGYTQRAADDSGGSTPMVRMYTAVAAGGESGSISVTKPAVNGKIYIAGVYRGVDTSAVVDVDLSTTNVGYSNASAATAYTIPGFTTTVAGVAILVSGSANASTGTWTPPTVPAAFTELLDTNGSVAAVPSICYDELIWSGSGATGNINLTRSTSIRGAAAAIALRPAAAATSSPEARRVVRRQRTRNPVSGVVRGVAVSETPPRQLFPVRSYRRPMRRVAPRTSGSFVSPPPVAPTPPTLVPDLRRSRVKGARVAKGRPLFVPPAQVAPVAPSFVPSVMSRRVRGLLRRRVGKAEAVAPQQTVPFSVAVARRVLRGLPARRSRKTEHIPHQPGSAANHFTVVRRTLRGIVARRVRRVEIVPAQVAVAPPTYVPTASQRRTLRGLLSRRGHRPEVVPPQQAAPVNPDLVHRVSQRRTVRGLLGRRGRRPEIVPPQATPATPVLVLRPALRRTVRGVASRRARRTQPIPPQTSPIQQTARRVRVVAVRRLRRIGAALGQAIAVIPTYGQMFNHKTTAPTAKDHDITVPKAADHDAAGPTMRGL
jgi:hypothetical protein